jgi:hypothetical protein
MVSYGSVQEEFVRAHLGTTLCVSLQRAGKPSICRCYAKLYPSVCMLSVVRTTGQVLGRLSGSTRMSPGMGLITYCIEHIYTLVRGGCGCGVHTYVEYCRWWLMGLVVMRNL